jgi:hypothetical protein
LEREVEGVEAAVPGLVTRRALLAGGVIALGALVGCARSPGGGGGIPPRQLLLTIRVAGALAAQNYYFLAISADGDPNLGPVPVLGPPWGNGWGAESITYYVLIHGGTAQLYRIRPGTNLLQSDLVGPPFDFVPPGPGGNSARVALDLDALFPAGLPEFVTVNYIATDIVPADPQFPGPKLVDAFGPPSRARSFVLISLRNSRVFSNADFDPPLEATGDVRRAPTNDIVSAPDLDISDWSIEVRR